MKRQELLDWMDRDILEIMSFNDYAPNGLQVEGKSEIKKIMCAVTASLASIEEAIAAGADMLLVHHGMFWKNEFLPIKGWKKTRIQRLLNADLNLAAYHLPLDAHPKIGNNAQLAAILGWEVKFQTAEQGLLFLGQLPTPLKLHQFSQEIEKKLKKLSIVIGKPEQTIHNIAWCTGGAQSFFQEAIDLGVDAFVTGEISEAQYHLAHETGVAFISAGHHATERYGIQALGREIQRCFGVEVSFFDEDNPA